MREANFSIPSANKASVGITPALYDRRALDCTSTLPLINSLNNLTYLTTSSARIRDILTVDGGVERLVCILKEGRSKDAMESWKWNLAFQCVFNIGVRGSEAVRTRVVEADMVPVVATLLDNYIRAMEKLKKRADEDARRTPANFNPFPNLQTPPRASRSPYQPRSDRTPRRSVPPPIDISATDDQPMVDSQQPSLRSTRLDFGRHTPMHDIRPQSSPQIRSEQASRQTLRPVRDADRLPSMLPNLNAELSSQPQSPTTPSATAPTSPRSSLGRRRPSIRHQLSISGNWEDEQSDDAVQDTSDTAETSPEPMVDIQNDISMQDIVNDETMLEGSATPVALGVPTVDVSESDAFISHASAQDGSTNTQTPTQAQPGFAPAQQLPSVDIVNATPPALMAPRAGVPFVSAPAPLAAALPRDEDVIMSLQLLAYVSKYCNLRSYFQASHLVPRLNIDSELRTLDADYDPSVLFTGPSQAELEEAWDNEFVEQPAYNIFPLIEKFTTEGGGPAQEKATHTFRRATSAMTGRAEVVTNDDDARRPLLSRSNTNDIDLDMAALNTRPGHEKWRRVVGLLLLFTTVILWTASNFMASTLFADNTYSKPYLVTYVNTACFIIPLLPIVVRRLYLSGSLKTPRYAAVPQDHDEDVYAQEHTSDSTSQKYVATNDAQAVAPLSLGETARLSLEFCILWFLANYFVAACLEHTTVASSTILTSTSSIFTLLLGCAVGVEIFTLRKLLGVLASLLGVVLISSVDLFGNNDDGRGLFPHKSARQVALGDAMALLSAVLYGIYAVLMKKRIGDERRISMPVFFGLVGLFNVLLLWPGFLILHFTGVEPFELPPTSRVTTIILVNSFSSLLSDIAWAYAVLLTSPIVVTVGLSTTIPLSLIGQLLINNQTSPAIYWLGACVVVLSFVFVNHEEAQDEAAQDQRILEQASSSREAQHEEA
ncbi:hypothetical protein KCU93_g3219, partial [Aureobasidium melanogenum]